MRIKLFNAPASSLKGYVWAEVCVGISIIAGVGFTIYPF